MAMLDTNVLIDLTRGHRTVHGRRAWAKVDEIGLRGEVVYASRPSEAEFRVGPHRAADPALELTRVLDVLALCTILEFDATAARIFAEVKAHLLNIGRPVGDMDVQIAAVALAGSQPLVTRNARHFADVPGLRVESC